MRLVHISDLHFGPPFRAEVAMDLLAKLHLLQADALVITGDFTQRARLQQFKAAAEFLQKASGHVPQLVLCPGNHDVAMYRLWERLLFPFRHYRQFIFPLLNHAVDVADARIVSLNTVHPLRHFVEGHLSEEQYRIASQQYALAPAARFRILSLHHPPPLEVSSFDRRGTRFLQFCQEQRIDLVMSGHTHESWCRYIGDEQQGQRTLLLGCGTSTSGRGRGDELSLNTFHAIDVVHGEIKVTTYLYAASGQFEIKSHRDFPQLHRA